MMNLIKSIASLVLVCTPLVGCTNEDTPVVDDEVLVTVSDKSGEDAYWALYNAHTEALKGGKCVKYQGGDINITIPEDAKPIPLTYQTDFNGTTLTVENKNIDGFFLFTLMGEAKPVDVNQSLLGGATLHQCLSLVRGRYFCCSGTKTLG